MKVLIVDDSIIIRGALEQWLGEIDMEIAGHASNGRQTMFAISLPLLSAEGKS